MDFINPFVKTTYSPFNCHEKKLRLIAHFSPNNWIAKSLRTILYTRYVQFSFNSELHCHSHWLYFGVDLCSFLLLIMDYKAILSKTAFCSRLTLIVHIIIDYKVFTVEPFLGRNLYH